MNKIMPEHLARSAFVYVRQSTPYQVVNNLESQRRQYSLVERARQLGWDDSAGTTFRLLMMTLASPASWRKLTKQWNQALSIDVDPATP